MHSFFFVEWGLSPADDPCKANFYIDAEGWYIKLNDKSSDNTSIAIDPNNKIHIVYVNGYGELKYVTNA